MAHGKLSGWKVWGLSLALGLTFAQAGWSQVTVDVDMDPVTPGIQPTIAASSGDAVTAEILITVGAGGVDGYSISLRIDNGEVTAGAPTEVLPAGFDFNFVPGVGTTVNDSPGVDRLTSYDAVVFFVPGSGPASTTFSIGTLAFTVGTPADDGAVDIMPGLFVGGIDSLRDHTNTDIAGPVFNGGSIIPEPASMGLLTVAGVTLLMARSRRSA